MQQGKMRPPCEYTRYKNSLVTLLLVSVTGLAGISGPAVFAASAQDVQKLDEIARSFFKEAEFPGMAVTIGHQGKVVWSVGYGYADVEQRVPVIPGTSRFRIGSVSKTMTARAVGQLVEGGRLDIDAPVQEYVPSFPEKRGMVTTRLVAGHLAGIRHYRGNEFMSRVHYGTVSDGLAMFQDDTLLFHPGTRYSYSSYGWNLVSAVVEQASGTDFLDYMADSVFTPLGMIRTVADDNGELIDYRTRFYVRDATGLRLAPEVNNSYKWAGGGFLSTTEDLVRLGFAHLDQSLRPETIDLLWSPQMLAGGSETRYGVGWASGTDEYGRDWVGQNGGSVGGSTRFRVYPEHNLVIAAVTNLSGASFNTLVEELVDTFFSVPEE